MRGDLGEHLPALSVQQFLTKNGMAPMPYAPYLPDLAQRNFSFFVPLMKKVLKKKHFAGVDERGETKN